MSGLRTISVEGLKFAGIPADKAAERPDLRWVDISTIVIDDAYQRPLARSNHRAIERIAAQFDWSRFTPCLVAPLRDGRFALIDGQHRTHAALLAGHAAVPCMVVPMDLRAQAQAFAWVNGQVTAITIFHIYKAALIAREAWAVEADLRVSAAGCRLMKGNYSAADKEPGQVFCVGLIRKMVEMKRGKLVERGLTALRSSSRGGVRVLYDSRFLDPWFAMLIDRPGLPTGKLTAFLDAVDPVALARGVDHLRDTPEHAGKSHRSLMAKSLDVTFRDWVRKTTWVA